MAFKDDMNLLGKYLQDNQDNQDNPSFNGSDGADGSDATALASGNTPVAAQNQVGGTGSVSVSPSTGTHAGNPVAGKPVGSAGTAGTGGVGAGTGATGVPTEEDIRIKGYMKAFSDLIPKTSYADDIKRQEKMQLFNLLANMGKVGMQSIAQTQGVRQFAPIQDESGKIQKRIEQFRALQRAADDKRNGTLLSLAIQQRDKDDAARRADEAGRRADAQFQFQREQAKINQGFNERRMAIQEKEAKENSAHRAWSRNNTEKEQEARNRQWGAEFGLKKKQWEYNTQPVLALSTKFGDLYVKNPEDIEGIVKSYLGRLASEGDQTSAELMARIMESSGSGNTQRAKNAYTSSLQYLNQLLDKNPDALMYIIRSVENEGGELRQSSYQKNAMRHYEYNLQYLYPGDNKPQRPVSTGQSGRRSTQSGGQSGSGGRAGTPNRDDVMNNPWGD